MEIRKLLIQEGIKEYRKSNNGESAFDICPQELLDAIDAKDA